MQHQQTVAKYAILDDSLIVILDSRNATKYNNGSFHSSVTFNLLEPIYKQRDVIQMRCSLVSFICPVSFYQINYTNNIFNIQLNNIAYKITIPDGNYQPQNFISTILALLPSGFSMSLNNITNKFKLTHNAYDFKIFGNSSSINMVMGFSNSEVYTSNSLNFIFPYCCNFSGLNNLNIHWANTTTGNIDSYNETVSSIIASIPVNTPPGGVIIYEKKYDFKFGTNDDSIGCIVIDLQDDLENYLDLNNQHWNMTLQFDKKREHTMRQNSFFDIIHHIPMNTFSKNQAMEEIFEEEMQDN